MILIVGDRPSKKNAKPDVPFVGTQSYKRLLDWIWRMDIDISEVVMANSTDGCLVDLLHEFDTVIALGVNAERIVKQYKMDYFKLPHPSGLNRQLNDDLFVRRELKRCKEWLNEKQKDREDLQTGVSQGPEEPA